MAHFGKAERMPMLSLREALKNGLTYQSQAREFHNQKAT